MLLCLDHFSVLVNISHNIFSFLFSTLSYNPHLICRNLCMGILYIRMGECLCVWHLSIYGIFDGNRDTTLGLNWNLKSFTYSIFSGIFLFIEKYPHIIFKNPKPFKLESYNMSSLPDLVKKLKFGVHDTAT